MQDGAGVGIAHVSNTLIGVHINHDVVVDRHFVIAHMSNTLIGVHCSCVQ